MKKLFSLASATVLAVSFASATFAGGPVIVAEEIEPAVETPGGSNFSGGILPIIAAVVIIAALVGGSSSSSGTSAPTNQ